MTPDRPRSIRELAEYRHQHPEIPAWKPLCEFLDVFYESGHASMHNMLLGRPQHIEVREGAYLAANVEYLSVIYKLSAPSWIEQPEYSLAEPWWPFGPINEALMELYCRESPEQFRRRNIFTERHPLRRKFGPEIVGSQDWWRP